MSQSAFFPSKILCVVIFWYETACVSKAKEWPRGWQMPGPRAAQNLLMPHSGTDKAGKCPAVARGGLGAAGIDWCIIWNTVWYQGPRRGRPLLPSPPPSTFWKKKKEKKRNTHFQIKRIFDGIRIFDWQTSPKHPNWWLVSFDPISYGDHHNYYLYKTQGHQATIFCKITVRRSKCCLEISTAWEERKISG